MLLDGVEILDIYGTGRITITGDYDEDSLADLLIENWVTYIDCDKKCARVDYCPYTVIEEGYTDKHKEIKCGVLTNFIRNFIHSTYDILTELDPQKYSNYFNGLFYLSQFVLSAEGLIGLSVSRRNVEWYGDASPFIFTGLIKLREELNKSVHEFKYVHGLNTKSSVIFVEGWSENHLLEKLKTTNSTWFTSLDIVVYEGSENIRPRRAEMLINDYHSRGYNVFIQGDNDGRNVDKFQDLKRKCGIDSENIFCFQNDLETSIPPQIFYKILSELYEEFSGITYETYMKDLESDRREISIIQKVNDIYSLDISHDKMQIADRLADILCDPRFVWWNKSIFMETELGTFLDFIIRIPY